MPTLNELMVEHRARLKKGQSPVPGLPVLIESAQSTEVVLPNPNSTQKRQSWSTKRINLKDADYALDEDERIERMTALQDLVTDSSQVLELKHTDLNKSKHVCIGRAKRNDIVIQDITISTLHATIDEVSSTRMLIDHNSKNGTFVNQEQLSAGQPMPLTSGDCVRFGRRVFYYLTGDRLLLFLELRIVKSGATISRIPVG